MNHTRMCMATESNSVQAWNNNLLIIIIIIIIIIILKWPMILAVMNAIFAIAYGSLKISRLQPC